jgi:hypothetical protein
MSNIIAKPAGGCRIPSAIGPDSHARTSTMPTDDLLPKPIGPLRQKILNELKARLVSRLRLIKPRSATAHVSKPPKEKGKG